MHQEEEIKPEGNILGEQLNQDQKCIIKIYDFKRPDKFSKDQMRTISIMHETFARLTTTSLSANLRSLVHIHVAAVDQLTYEEFIRSIPNPTTLAVINMDPLKGAAVLEIDPSITFSMIDRLFGGQGEETMLMRDLTDIEQSVMEGIIIRVLGNLREAWSAVIGLRPILGQIETNPMFAQIVPPTEMVVLVTLDARVGEVAGMMNFCIPYLTIEPLIPKLSAQYWYSSVRPRQSSVKRFVAGSIKTDAQIFTRTEDISLCDLAQLGKNSLIKLKDWDKKICFLHAGDKVLLRLKEEIIEKKTIYRVIPEEKAEGDWDIADFVQQQKAQTEYLEQYVNKPLENLKADLKKSIESLAVNMQKLKKRQLELADQVFQGSADSKPAEAATLERFPSKPFDFIRAEDIDTLFNFIQQEHPQLIALVLSYLEPGMTAGILAKLSEELQADIIKRIATLDRVLPEVLKEIERVLQKVLKYFTKMEIISTGGVENVVDILNVCSRYQEKAIIESIEKKDAELAEEIKKRMFVFEDTILLDATTIKKLINRIDKQVLLLALKVSLEPKVKDLFLNNMEPEKRKQFEQELKNLGRIRLSRGEEAQQKIVSVLKEMEESGEVEILRAEEMVE